MSSRAEWIQRVLPIAMIVGSVVAVPALAFSSSGLRRLAQLREERVRAEREESELGARIRELRAQVDRSKHDPRAVERVARDELGLVRPTEVVFQFR
jgi:cell division protein FtsB